MRCVLNITQLRVLDDSIYFQQGPSTGLVGSPSHLSISLCTDGLAVACTRYTKSSCSQSCLYSKARIRTSVHRVAILSKIGVMCRLGIQEIMNELAFGKDLSSRGRTNYQKVYKGTSGVFQKVLDRCSCLYRCQRLSTYEDKNARLSIYGKSRDRCSLQK